LGDVASGGVDLRVFVYALYKYLFMKKIESGMTYTV
jgi:hypothetical protein